MDVDMLRSSAGDHMDMMTMMMQMEKLPEFCDAFHDTPTYPAEIEFSDGSTSSVATTPPIFHSSPNKMAPPTLENPPASLPFMGSTPTIHEPLSLRPPDQRFRNNIASSGTALSLPNNSYHDQKNSSMVEMREMIFRIAAMQPILIDPESIKPPKRRNVKISKDPQSVAARHRRERISERIRILQRLVPGGTKMDTASMLDEAIHYVKFLKKQVQTLEQAGTKRTVLGVGFPVGMKNANVVSYSSLAKAACSNGAGVLYPNAQQLGHERDLVGFM
ncbi:hypothetical protein F2P56_013920 [Juglans regia]|uniref:BHLH domain-containing protein n=2 Tax=Juglans regia TaxID=51240 RepID=A0A833XC77_JUGRE|nr:transcription factor HEC1-like [Juglans regia]KAF5463787.1 hypothetical protein F2P56_013920 [Juglans regia]